jgi:hypothetical protein
MNLGLLLGHDGYVQYRAEPWKRFGLYGQPEDRSIGVNVGKEQKVEGKGRSSADTDFITKSRTVGETAVITNSVQTYCAFCVTRMTRVLYTLREKEGRKEPQRKQCCKLVFLDAVSVQHGKWNSNTRVKRSTKSFHSTA